MSEKFNRFILFLDDLYYPSGGIDGRPSFETLDAAIEAAEKDSADYKEIFDCDERKVVWRK